MEGETCADALWKLDIPATTNIGGSGKWRPSDTNDLANAKEIVLCPDRDKPGIKHMEDIAKNFNADSRFRYDPNFLKERVCPPLLNKMLSELKQIAVRGIDYSCTSKALEEIQKETNHLWAFAQDVGLEEHPEQD